MLIDHFIARDGVTIKIIVELSHNLAFLFKWTEVYHDKM